MRFAHFHALVCAVNDQAEEVLEREHSLFDKVCLALLTNNVGCVIHWVEIAPNGKQATAGYTNPAGTRCLQLLIDIEYICDIPAFIGVWGVDDNGGKGVFCGTLLLR
jgi:hypothetical protein